MPWKGYRKGVSDHKLPRPELLRARTTTLTRHTLQAEAIARGLTLSSLIGELLDAHANRRAPSLPHACAQDHALIREFARLGNNLNQIAREANRMHLTFIAEEARYCIEEINQAVRRLA